MSLRNDLSLQTPFGSLSARFPEGVSPVPLRLGVGLLAALAALTGCYTRLSPPTDLTATAGGEDRVVVYDAVPIYYEWYGGFGPYLSYYGYHHHHGEVPEPTYGGGGPAPVRDGFGRGGRDDPKPARDVVGVKPVRPALDRPADADSSDEGPTEKPEKKEATLGGRGGRK